MRVSDAQAKLNRENSVARASKLFRERGFDGVGLKELMKSAGFSHGAFYGQFESKADLMAQATEHAIEEGLAKWRAVAGKPDTLSALCEFYLCTAHRDFPADGCALPALAADAFRDGPAVKSAFTAGVREHLEILGEALEAEGAESNLVSAPAMLAMMVGAVALSRALDDDALSQEILNAVAREIRGSTSRGRANVS